jgi:hypothetical protein
MAPAYMVMNIRNMWFHNLLISVCVMCLMDIVIPFYYIIRYLNKVSLLSDGHLMEWMGPILLSQMEKWLSMMN